MNDEINEQEKEGYLFDWLQANDWHEVYARDLDRWATNRDSIVGWRDPLTQRMVTFEQAQYIQRIRER